MAMGAVLVVGVAAAFWSRRPSEQPTAGMQLPHPNGRETPVAAVQGDPTAPASEDAEPVLPPAFYQKLPPNSRIPLTLPKGIKSGIRCPDGSFLPLLNGVPYAQPLLRPKNAGPLPAVVAKVTDSGGYEWYEHADGSFTTARWTPMVKNNEPTTDVVTDHISPEDPDNGVTVPDPPPIVIPKSPHH